MQFPQSGSHLRLTSPHLPLLNLLILTVVLPTATANTRVTVKLNKYTNADNTKDENDRFCNDNQSPCNIEFDVKLLDPVTFFFTTAPRVVDEIIFTDSITATDGSAIPNPFPGTEEEQTVGKGIKKLQLVLDLWHVAENGDKFKMARFAHRRWFDSWGSVTNTLTDKLGHSSVNLTTNIKCAPDHYRKPLPPPNEQDLEVSNCTYCVETDKYTCNQEDGTKICKPGWQGVHCDAVVPENCPAIEEANSTITPSTYKTDSLEVGYTLTFSCPGPYLSYLSASPFMTCLDTAHWNSTVPSCIPVVQNIDKKMNSLRNIGLFVLAGVLVTFSSAVFAMSFITSYMTSSNAASLSNATTSEPPYKDKSQFVEETAFEPDYTDKTYLVGDAGPGTEHELGANSQQIKVKLNSLELGVEDVDF